VEHQLINAGGHPIPGPDGPVQAFEQFTAGARWLRRHSSHRIMSVEEYDDMIQRFDRTELQVHVKKRRKYTDEDLTATGRNPELRGQLYLEREPDLQGGDD